MSEQMLTQLEQDVVDFLELAATRGHQDPDYQAAFSTLYPVLRALREPLVIAAKLTVEVGENDAGEQFIRSYLVTKPGVPVEGD